MLGVFYFVGQRANKCIILAAILTFMGAKCILPAKVAYLALAMVLLNPISCSGEYSSCSSSYNSVCAADIMWKVIALIRLVILFVNVRIALSLSAKSLPGF